MTVFGKVFGLYLLLQTTVFAQSSLRVMSDNLFSGTNTGIVSGSAKMTRELVEKVIDDQDGEYRVMPSYNVYSRTINTDSATYYISYLDINKDIHNTWENPNPFKGDVFTLYVKPADMTNSWRWYGDANADGPGKNDELRIGIPGTDKYMEIIYMDYAELFFQSQSKMLVQDAYRAYVKKK